MLNDIGLKEEQNIHSVRKAILAAPSFPKLKARAKSFWQSLYGPYGVRDMTARLMECDDEPELYLNVHATVMNIKSGRAKTLIRLTDAIFQETGLPRKPLGKFRGDDSIDWASFDLTEER